VVDPSSLPVGVSIDNILISFRFLLLLRNCNEINHLTFYFDGPPALPSPLRREDDFPVSVFLLLAQIKRRAGAFVAPDLCVLRAHFNRRRSAVSLEMGGSEGASSLPGS
jgi:hypothetical protein